MREYISFFLFSYFYFQLSVFIGGVGTVAIKIDQVGAESKRSLLFFFVTEIVVKKKGKTKGKD